MTERGSSTQRGECDILLGGPVKPINLEVLEKLARGLGCDPGYLIVKSGK